MAVRSGDRTIYVTCVFATGSQAQGCRIELVTDGPPHLPSMEAEALRGEANGELEREASTSFTDLEAGTYNVLIFDMGVNGTFDLNNKSLYHELIEIFSPSIEPVQTHTSTSTVTFPGMQVMFVADTCTCMSHHSGISLVLISSCPAPSSSSSIPTPSSVDDGISSKYHCSVCLY